MSDALLGGKSTDDALDKLRAGKPTRFRVEQRLPNPADGDLTFPGPETGTLEGRALAHLMRYCEDYVITCAIEVWRGNENARVEYKRGEIGGVTVGGIDAPERLAEVMQWSSGNYRLVVPPLKLPAVAPKRPQAAGRHARARAGARAVGPGGAQASATKTIFGMPAAEIIKARAAAEAARGRRSAAHPARTTTGPNVIVSPQASGASPPGRRSRAHRPPRPRPRDARRPGSRPARCRRRSPRRSARARPRPSSASRRPAAPGGYIAGHATEAPAAEAAPAAPATDRRPAH